jgi:eukaryotic-like serine/threonine-protein kinase
MLAPPLAGRYVLRRELGSGAYARVFLADDQKLSRAVAVKVLNDQSALSPETVQRLEREGRVTAGISHPNVCAVYDIGRLDNGVPFLVMEHLTGETLASRLLREPKLPIATAVDFGEQILLGLFAAHRLGIVHRDVKPANVFIVDLGHGRYQIKLLDFGAAYLTAATLREDATLTRAGLVIGTPEYMSPEQLRGLRDFDARTDIYPCGVVLFQMLTGRTPFIGLVGEPLRQAIAFKQPPSLASVAPEVPAPIARAVDTALAVNPNRRHIDTGAFVAALRETPRELEATGGRVAHREPSTRQGPGRPPASASASGGGAADWDLATDRSGPPSALDTTAPLPKPAIHPDPDLDETLQQNARPPKRR